MQQLRRGRDLDARRPHLMAGRSDDAALVALGLAGVVVGTAVFTGAARRLGWHPLAISLVLFGAGRIASLW